MFAKLEEGRLILCHRNGYIGKTAISNIDLYFEKNPEIAEKEGWKPIVFAEEPVENPVYIDEDGIIYERENANS